MAAKKFRISFRGYWLKPPKNGEAARPGIYCVYAASTSPEKGKIRLRRLLFIGESENVAERMTGHGTAGSWSDQLIENEALCFSFAAVEGEERGRIAAALVREHRPPGNGEAVDFAFESTTVQVAGSASKLSPSFTITRAA